MYKYAFISLPPILLYPIFIADIRLSTTVASAVRILFISPPDVLSIGRDIDMSFREKPIERFG